MSTSVPGLGDAVGSIFGFFPALVQAVGGVAGSVPGIAAAFGEKHAVSYADQQASIACAQAGGAWVPATRTCDMTLIEQAHAVAIQQQAATDKLKAWAFPAVLGLGAIGLTYATVKAFGRRAS